MPLNEIAEISSGPREERGMGDDLRITPRWVEVAHLLWNRRLRIALWVAVGLASSYFFVWYFCKYEATVELMPPDNASGGLSSLLPALSRGGPVSSGLAGLAGDLVGAKSTTALFAKMLQSRTVEDSLIDRFDLLKVYGKKYHTDGRKRLSKSTSIEEDKKSGVLTVTVRDRDPKLALALARGYTEELDRLLSKVATSSARREREFIEQRLVEEKKALEQAEQKLSQFSSGSMTLDVPQQIRVTVDAAARLQGELLAARAELQGLQEIYANENVRVKTLRARIAVLEKQLIAINSGQPGGKSADPTNPYPSVKALPQLGVQWTDLYRESKIHETVFEMLTQQYEMARIQEAKEIPVAKVMDEPAMPEKRYPRWWLVVLLCTLTTGLLASFGVVLQDHWEHWDPTDPRRELLVNVYGGAVNLASKAAIPFKKRG